MKETARQKRVLRSALGVLDSKLRARFGQNYRRLMLFGSRARGDSGRESDADVDNLPGADHRSLVGEAPHHPRYIPDPPGNRALYTGLAAGGGRTRRSGQFVKPGASAECGPGGNNTLTAAQFLTKADAALASAKRDFGAGD